MDVYKYAKEMQLQNLSNQIATYEIKIENLHKKLERLFNKDVIDKMIHSEKHLFG